MNITYQTKLSLAIASDIALKNRLYVSGWSLSCILQLMRKNHAYVAKAYPHCKIILAYDKTTPIGVAVCDTNASVSVFVRKAYRRQKIGSALIKRLLAEVPKTAHSDIHSHLGIQNSEYFWESNKIDWRY